MESESSAWLKYRYLNGVSFQGSECRYDGIQMPVAGVEGNSVAANTKWIATPWKGGGGQVFVTKAIQENCKFNGSEPKITGHSKPVQDLSFSPYDDNLLGTCSTDGTVKVWKIPEEGFTENVNDAHVELAGHAKKVTLCKWHPTSDNIMGSCSMDNTVKIWDITKSECKLTCEGLEGIPQSLEWNINGSMYGCITKGKKLYANDPRTDEPSLVTNSHEGIKI